MPDQVYRVTTLFEAGKQGWSETFWKMGAGHLAVATLATAIIKKRLKLSGYGVKTTYVRISDEAIRGDSVIVATNFSTGGGENNPLGPDYQIVNPAFQEWCDVSWNGVLVRQDSGSQTRRVFCMRGVPDGLIVMPDGPVANKAWDDAFDVWSKSLFQEGWGFIALNKDPGTNPIKPITGITNTADGLVLSVAAHGFLEGEYIRVSGVKAALPKLVNGIHQVSVINLNSVLLKGSSTANPGYQRGGEARAQRKIFVPITGSQVRRQAKRQPGRPFDQLAGRRARKK